LADLGAPTVWWGNAQIPGMKKKKEDFGNTRKGKERAHPDPTNRIDRTPAETWGGTKSNQSKRPRRVKVLTQAKNLKKIEGGLKKRLKLLQNRKIRGRKRKETRAQHLPKRKKPR